MTTVPVFLKDIDAYSIQFSTPAGATLVGSFALQVSNDRGNQEQTGRPDVTMVNWTPLFFTIVATDVRAATLAVASGAQALMVKEPVCAYRWVRLVFTFTSGTGTPRISLQQKGWP
jgi:hypothetical protein